jgi:hypothetical protein
MPDVEAGQKEFALLPPRLCELLQDDLGDDMLVRLVLRSLGHQRLDTPQDLPVGGHLLEGRRTDSHSLHLPCSIAVPMRTTAGLRQQPACRSGRTGRQITQVEDRRAEASGVEEFFPVQEGNLDAADAIDGWHELDSRLDPALG